MYIRGWRTESRVKVGAVAAAIDIISLSRGHGITRFRGGSFQGPLFRGSGDNSATRRAAGEPAPSNV